MSISEKVNAKRRARRETRCKHFTGIQNDACKVGVAYDSVRDRSVRPFRLPCLDDCATSCAKRELLTAEEVANEEAAFKKRIGDTFVARNAIVEKLGPWKKPHGSRGGTQGSMPCPVCRAGELHYSRADFNGHIHASCETPDCVRWME